MESHVVKTCTARVLRVFEDALWRVKVQFSDANTCFRIYYIVPTKEVHAIPHTKHPARETLAHKTADEPE